MEISWVGRSSKFWQSQEGCEDELNPVAPSPFLIIANKISKGPVILNVGGKRHEVVMIWWECYLSAVSRCGGTRWTSIPLHVSEDSGIVIVITPAIVTIFVDHQHQHHHQHHDDHHDKQTLRHPPWSEATLHLLLSWDERVLLWQVVILMTVMMLVMMTSDVFNHHGDNQLLLMLIMLLVIMITTNIMIMVFTTRSPRNFDAVLGLYRTNKLHLAAGVCVQVWDDSSGSQ